MSAASHKTTLVQRIAATCRLMLMAAIMQSSAVAQVVTGSELCSDAPILGGLQRARGLPNPPSMLFDGREPLTKQPVLPLKIDSSLLSILPACALLSVTFTEHAGAVYVDQSGPIAMTSRNRMAISRSGSAFSTPRPMTMPLTASMPRRSSTTSRRSKYDNAYCVCP